MIQSTLDVIVSQLFDYSGMFPPEGKSFQEALADSAKFAISLTRPYLCNADIVLSFDQLSRVTDEVLIESGFSPGSNLTISALGTQLNDVDKLLSEIQFVEKFNRENANGKIIKKQIVSYEVKVPQGARINREVLEKGVLLKMVDCIIALEPDLSGEEWLIELEKTLQSFMLDKDFFSLKIRGTGVTGIGNEKIASVLMAISDGGYHLKATGGLHHPIIEADVYKNDLGFLNLSVALWLRNVYGKSFTYDQILRCLETSSNSQFFFDDTVLRWEDLTIAIEELRTLKERCRFSIGSCSLHEPDADLRRLF